MRKAISILLIVVLLCLVIGCNSSVPTLTITYDENENTSGTAPAAQTDCLYGENVTLAENTGSLARTDYVFAGWNTKADGTGTSYAAGETVLQGFTGDTTLYAKWLKLNPIGGRVFYMHDDNGVAYTFYDSSKKAFNETTLVQKNTGDVNAIRNMDKDNNWNKVAYYTVDNKGEKAADKFYVYDIGSRTIDVYNSTVPVTQKSSITVTGGLAANLKWGYYEEITGVTAKSIGSGKTNTATILGKSQTIGSNNEPNIWGYVKVCNTYDEVSGVTGVGGCIDWFIPSKLEVDMLRESGLVSTWFARSEGRYIWSSSEVYRRGSWLWKYDFSVWSDVYKGYPANVVAVRAF